MILTSDKNTIGLTYSMAFEEYQITKNKNLFEEVIDRMMLDGFSPEFSSKIMSLPLKDKRMAILSLLDKDRDLFLKIKGLINNDIGKMDHIKDVILMLRKYVKVGEVEKKKFGEVMTPLELVKEMLATLPDEVWSNPNLKWLDPSNGTGPYPMWVIFKLMKGLEKWEPNEEKRYKHIVENMIYVCELQPKNMFLYMCAVDPWDIYNLNIYTGSFLESGFDKHMKEVWGIDRVDIVIGNPPYNSELDYNKGSATPLYNLFTEKSIKISDQTIFVTPSRWFAGGKGLDGFRNMMISSKKIRSIKHYDSVKNIFSNVEMKGGLSYFLFDNKYNGSSKFNDIELDLSLYDIIPTDVSDSAFKLINRFVDKKNIDEICKGQSYAGITSNDKRLKVSKESENDIICYVSIQKGVKKFIDKTKLKNISTLEKYKIFTSEVYGAGPAFNPRFYIGYPNDVCSQTYICFIVNSEKEAESLKSYLSTKFANKILSFRKISQHINPNTCKWIPIVPFDREWTDDQLFEYFNLTEEERNLILNHSKK
jgi:site-specific DNA-methyltransferase (adenine-specific)